MDGCVYLRDNEEYCFVEKPKEEGATVVCEAATSPFFTGSSTSPMTPTGSTSTESTRTYPTPSKCGDLKTAMDDITNALDGTNDATYNPTKAVAIVAILTILEANNLDPACSQDDVDELETKKTSASSKAAEVVATQTKQKSFWSQV